MTKIVVQGSLNRILMPDGTYLEGDAGGDASSWARFNKCTVFGGTANINGVTNVYFTYAFPTACLRVIVSEANPAGWSTNSFTGYGCDGFTTSYAVIRGFRKYDGGSPLNSPASGISCNWVAIGY
jgi:hypothetical protein